MEIIDKQELSADTLHKQDFYTWLTTIPLGVLYRLYKQHHARQPIISLDGTPGVLHVPSAIQKNHIVLRKSVFILVLTMINIEILFDVAYMLLRLPPMYVNFPSALVSQLSSIYFFILVAINCIKLVLIIYICMKWITTTYEIKEGEIKLKKGIISVDQKTYLCRHTQEVICKQGLIGKLFNFGSIEIYDPTLATNITLDSIQNPCKYAEIIRKNLLLYKDSELVPFIPKEEIVPQNYSLNNLK